MKTKEELYRTQIRSIEDLYLDGLTGGDIGSEINSTVKLIKLYLEEGNTEKVNEKLEYLTQLSTKILAISNARHHAFGMLKSFAYYLIHK